MVIDTKPPYVIPSMASIREIPANGYNLVSTFSGCGGGCLGFAMAGFHTLWASEFIPAAQEVYRLNHPDVNLDIRDIRTVAGSDILRVVGRRRGDIDVLEGSPPCASFSVAGKREASWGRIVKYSDTKQRVDDLFYEYIRLISELEPRVFVAENVSGLVIGKAKGYFKEIFRQMERCGYHVEARLLDAAWLGVPQSRKRIIYMGVRTDLGARPRFPKPLPYQYTVRDAIPWINRGRFGRRGWLSADRPSPTVSQSLAYNPATNNQGLELIEAETDISRYAIGAEWGRLRQGGNSAKYFHLTRAHVDRPSPTVTAIGGAPSKAVVVHPTEQRKFSIAELKRICGFPDDFQLTGTYTQQWERLGRAVPPPMMYAVAKCVQEVLDGSRT